MRKIRVLPIVATMGLTFITTAGPAGAYLIEAVTSIPAGEVTDEPTLEKAVRAAVADVTSHAIAFRPTMVSLQEAKLVGDRIYLFILLADAAGEAEIEVLKADTARASQDPR